MAKEEVMPSQEQGIGADINIRINDLEEKTNNIKEKTNLISKNFILIKEEFEKKIEKIESENSLINRELSALKKTITNLSQESEKWVRRDEIVLIERMLKDFQPLEFVRKKDFEEALLKKPKLDEEDDLEKNKKPKKLIKT